MRNQRRESGLPSRPSSEATDTPASSPRPLVNDQELLRRALGPPTYELHECAEAGCVTLTFSARCPRHETPDDETRIAAMHHALLSEAEAGERWLASLLTVLEAERDAGVRRANPQFESQARAS